jgi:hypothetical protein
MREHEGILHSSHIRKGKKEVHMRKGAMHGPSNYSYLVHGVIYAYMQGTPFIYKGGNPKGNHASQGCILNDTILYFGAYVVNRLAKRGI